MNLLEALKQISENTDDKQSFMPTDKDPNFPIGKFRGQPSSLLREIYRQTAEAQQGPTSLLNFNPDALARFMAQQEPSRNIEDRRGKPPQDEFLDPGLYDRLLKAPPLKLDPNDPLAQLLGINSVGRPQGMTFEMELPSVPLPRPRPR